MPRDMQEIDRTQAVVMRKPEARDGSAIWDLVRQCKPLDENSMYCNLVQADHFRDTCVLAEIDGQVLGWVSGHLIPNEDALFVWQVAVSPEARGMGLGLRMLTHLLNRPECAPVRALKTTITRDNDASWALFRSLARRRGGAMDADPHYLREDHFDGKHATEHMVSISLPPRLAASRAA